MQRFVVKGKNKLIGEVNISGAKNAAVALVPATLLARDISVIDNLPKIKDIDNFLKALKEMGAEVEFIADNTMRIDSSKLDPTIVPTDYLRRIRASYYLLGVLLARYGYAEVPLPGGCDFGGRPFDQHIKGFEALGAEVKVEDGSIKVKGDKLIGTSIYLDVVSVGATINVMMAAVFAEGTTVIENAAKEPHIVDTANLLNKMGCNVKGAGTDVIKVVGVSRESVKGTDYTTIPDQIEAGTYMILAASTNGDIKVNNIIPKHLESISAKLMEMGCIVEEDSNSVRVIGTENLKCTNFKTQVYPGFPTDMQPQMLTLQTIAEGYSRVEENVWNARYQYTAELIRMGAKVETNGKIADVTGVDKLNGTTVKALDLRGGVSMVIAGTSFKTEGETIITNAKLIDRGYESIIEKLVSLGADIRKEIVTEDEEF